MDLRRGQLIDLGRRPPSRLVHSQRRLIAGSQSARLRSNQTRPSRSPDHDRAPARHRDLRGSPARHPTRTSTTRASPSTSRRCSTGGGCSSCSASAGWARVSCRSRLAPDAAGLRRRRRRPAPPRPRRPRRQLGGGRRRCATVIPEETGGPFPGDGSNGPDVLNQSGVVRKDIRIELRDLTGTAAGVPLTISFVIQDAANGLAPLAERRRLPVALRPRGSVLAVLAGRHRPELPARRAGGRRRRRRDVHEHLPGLLFGALAAHPLRGLSEPREGHRRREQDRDLADRPAQAAICDAVYATDGYAQKRPEPEPCQPRRDNVFGNDGGVHQIGTMSGSIENGLTVTLDVPVQTA